MPEEAVTASLPRLANSSVNWAFCVSATTGLIDYRYGGITVIHVPVTAVLPRENYPYRGITAVFLPIIAVVAGRGHLSSTTPTSVPLTRCK